MALVSWNTTRAATVDARFASFTIDSWWLEMWARNINGTYNFTDPRLARLVRDLGPSVLRVGGGKSDTSYFGGGPLAPGGLCHRTYCWNLTVPSWETFAQFVDVAQLDLVFGLNAVLRNQGGAWDSRNAAAFIAYNRQRGHAVYGYELGNEPGDHPTGPAGWANVSLAAHAADFGDLQELLAREFGGGPRPLVMGPDACMPDYMRGLLALRPAVNVTTAHKYFCMDVSGSFQNCSLSDMLSPSLAPAIARSAAQWAKIASAAPVPAWLGEGAVYWNHHSPLNFEQFAIVPAYLQELGELARSGLSLFAKQSLVDLIQPTTLGVTPNYWAALLWKRLMGTSVYAASVQGDASARVRLYVHGGAADAGASWALCLVNLGANATAVTGLPTACGSRQVYALTAPGANTTSRVVLLNGAALELAPDGGLPEIRPRAEECASRLALPPMSATFVVMEKGEPHYTHTVR